MSMHEMHGIDQGVEGMGFAMPPDVALLAQVANELFREMPGLPVDAGAPVTAVPVDAGMVALRDVPQDVALTSAPGIPALGIMPTELAVNAIPTTGGVPWHTTVPLSQAGSVPAVGDGGFLRDIGQEANFGAIPVFGDFPKAEAGSGMLVPGDLPGTEADLLKLAIDGLALSGLSTPTEVGTPFYFLPAPALPVATSEGSARFDVEAVRRDFPALHQQVNGKPLIWLDNAATTQKPQAVIDAIAHFYAHDNSNIHRGAHTLAARATDAYEETRTKVQFFLGARSTAEIIFTRGSTEAINLVAQSFGRQFISPGDEILVSTLEHHSNIVPWQFLAREKGAVLRVIPIDEQGQVLLDAYEQLLTPRTKLVAIAHVSNVLGTVQPISLMVQMAHRYGAKVLVDGAQGASHLPVNMQALDADFYVLSGHKLFAPTGVGVLYGKQELLDNMPPWQGGGSMIESVSFEETTFSPLPAKFEAGTPPIAEVVGLGAAIDYVNRFGMESIAAYEEGLMTYATAALDAIPGLRQIGTAPGKVGALAFVIPGIRSEELGRFLDHEGIAVRAGHHCAQPTLAHYGLTAAVRPSISLYNTPEEIDALVAAIRKAVAQLS